MNATAWVGIAGIVSTLVGTLLGSVLAERMRRETARREKLLTQRLAVYADLLRVTARLADNAITWSAIPLADLRETDSEEMDRVISQARVVARADVYECLGDLSRNAHEFNRLLDSAKVYHQRIRAEGKVDDAASIQQRMALGDIADKLTASYKRLLDLIRNETSS